MPRKNFTKNLKRKDGNVSASHKIIAKIARSYHLKDKVLQGYVDSSLKAMFKDRLKKVNQRIDNVLKTILNLDRKISEMHDEMESSELTDFPQQKF